ncbi:MAG: ion transporter [Planctomycetota bacterium]
MSQLVTLCRNLRDNTHFERGVLVVILVAGVLVGLETSPTVMERYGELLRILNGAILGIFILEVLVKIFAEGRTPWRYFRSGWNVFDFLVVVACLLPTAGAWVAVARLARVLRVLRLATMLEELQIIVSALLRTIPSMGYVTLLLMLHFYVYAVAGVSLYRGNDPGHFGDLGLAFLTLFRVVTLEDWTDVMYTAIYGSDVYAAQGAIPLGSDPQAFGVWGALYFVSFVVVGAMVMVNLFIGVILTSITEVQAESLKAKLDIDMLKQQDASTLEELQKIEDGIANLRRQLSQPSPPPGAGATAS